MLRLRAYEPDDAPALLVLFRDTIRRVNARDYAPYQVRAWATVDIDTAAWAGRFAGRCVVAEESARPVGFAELEPGGHIDRVYVSAEHQRRGVGRALLEGVVDEARRRGIARLSVEASITARPFFESLGFAVLAPQLVSSSGRSSSTTAWNARSPDPQPWQGRPAAAARGVIASVHDDKVRGARS